MINISFSSASRVIQAAISEAESSSKAVGIAIVDEGGYLIAAYRMEGAQLISVHIAIGKATAAAFFGKPTKELAERWQSMPAIPMSVTIKTGGNFLAQQGGLPLFQDGKVVGGIGVSGAPKEIDERIAEVGLRLFQ